MVITKTVPSDAFAVQPLIAFDSSLPRSSDESAVLLLVCTSLFFLVPARTSFLLGRLWHAWVFLLLVFTCVAYHACNGDLHSRLGVGGSCPDEMRQLLTLIHHGVAYFCLLQMAYLVLGPEDPHMQWIDHPVVLDTPRSALAMAPPVDVLVVSRILPTITIVCFLGAFSSWEDFHWQMIILLDALVLFGCSVFWLHRDRRASMPKVLLRIRFWRRLWNHCAVPLFLSTFILVVMAGTDSDVMHSVWHVILSAVAVSIIRVVHHKRGDLRSESEVTNVSPQNPVVARVLLGSVAMFGLPTLLLSLIIDWWSVGYWRWPMVSKPTHQRPGGYFVAIGALPTFVAQAVAFWLIGSTSDSSHTCPEEIALSKRFGCLIGYVSVGFGMLTIAIQDSVFPTMHTLCMIVFLCSMMVATLLTTLSAKNPFASSTRVRCILSLTIFISVLGFLMLLILVQQYVPNSYSIPRSLLAMSEYTALALQTIWPVTWGPEVQARWQTHKIWRSFGSRSVGNYERWA